MAYLGGRGLSSSRGACGAPVGGSLGTPVPEPVHPHGSTESRRRDFAIAPSGASGGPGEARRAHRLQRTVRCPAPTDPVRRAALTPMPPPSATTIRADLRRAQPRSVPTWRPLRQAWSRALKDAPAPAVFQIAQALLDEEPWGRLTAYELIAYHPGAMATLTPARLRRLARGLADWVGVDTLGCYVAGPAWRDGLLTTAVVHGWARSADRWQRRLAVVCTVPLNLRARGGGGDPVRTLEVCRRVVADRDDMVVKALSWALRSLVVWDATAVATFLDEHRATLAPRVAREVGTKLRTGRKR